MSVLWRAQPANGHAGQPGWQPRSEAQLLFRLHRQTSLPEENHSNDLVNLHPNRTCAQLAALASSPWPQQLTVPMPWLCRLGPAPHTSMRHIECHPHTVVTCPRSLVLLLSSRREPWRCCFVRAAPALRTPTHRTAFGKPVEKRDLRQHGTDVL